MTVLLCDIGGTHIRFALTGAGEIKPHKSRADAHLGLGHAIKVFLSGQSVQADSIKKFCFAFSNRNEWNTSEDEIRTVLPQAEIIQVNDFEANAHGIMVGGNADCDLLNKPEVDIALRSSRVVIGAGTGLGFAYIHGEGSAAFIQRSHGAHMLPAYAPEYTELYEHIARDKKDALIYEDMATGRGLYEIYKFLSARNHLDVEYPDTEILMRDGKDNPVFREALSLFHEILGLFAHQAVAFGYAYGGIYLTGGVIDRLMISGLFDVNKFMTSFNRKLHPIVMRDVAATPLYWVRDEFISLKGLQYLAERGAAHD